MFFMNISFLIILYFCSFISSSELTFKDQIDSISPWFSEPLSQAALASPGNL